MSFAALILNFKHFLIGQVKLMLFDFFQHSSMPVKKTKLNVAASHYLYSSLDLRHSQVCM